MFFSSHFQLSIAEKHSLYLTIDTKVINVQISTKQQKTLELCTNFCRDVRKYTLYQHKSIRTEKRRAFFSIADIQRTSLLAVKNAKLENYSHTEIIARHSFRNSENIPLSATATNNEKHERILKKFNTQGV
ncbi:hypothetical protein GJ496_010066 [Pomphorhynchus laevis]|nr:hypothetical protein GJ496_010066 [Pomphorhynchus laevis]